MRKLLALLWVFALSACAGGGMQIAVASFEPKKFPDIVVGGKSGLFLFRSPAATNKQIQENHR